MPVIVMRGPYMKFLQKEIESFKDDIQSYDRTH